VLLKDLLVGCGSNRGCDEGDEETRPATHNALGGGGGQSVVAAGSGGWRSFIHRVCNPDELGHRVLLSLGRFGLSFIGAKCRSGRNRSSRMPVIGSKLSLRKSEKGPITDPLGKCQAGIGCLVY
jgi:hypothetical protein